MNRQMATLAREKQELEAIAAQERKAKEEALATVAQNRHVQLNAIEWGVTSGIQADMEQPKSRRTDGWAKNSIISGATSIKTQQLEVV
jgi:hypothetical protein